MLGFKSSKKAGTVCTICGNEISEESKISDLCLSCFNRCVLLSKQLEYLQTTSVANLKIFQDEVSISGEPDDLFAIKSTPSVSETGEKEIVSESIREAYILRTSNNEKFTLKDNLTTVGRSPEKADIAFPDNTKLSRVHIEFVNVNGEYFVSDKKSMNGSGINGVKMEPEKQYSLKSGDSINLPAEKLIFYID